MEAGSQASPEVDQRALQRAIVGAITALPRADRDLVLGRYRDDLSIRRIAELRGESRGRIAARMSTVLEGLGEDVRERCGGSRAVALRALERCADGAPAGSSSSRRRLASVALAAASILILLTAAWSGWPSPAESAPAEVYAESDRARVEVASTPMVKAADPTDTTRTSDVAAESAPTELEARLASEVVLYGRVTLIGGPGSTEGGSLGRNLGQARADRAGIDRVALVDEHGRFSLAGLGAGTWRVTVRVTGYETVSTEVLIDPAVDPDELQLVAHAALEYTVEVRDDDGLALFDLAGSSDDWSMTHGFTVWAGDTPPGERVDRVSLGASSTLERPWERVADFERLAPIDMDRPEVIGSITVERPRDVSWVALVFGDRVVDLRPWSPLDGDGPRFVVDRDQLDSMRAGVRLLLRSQLGLDVAGAQVRLFGPNGEVLTRRVAADGTLSLDGLPPGNWLIEVEQFPHGLLRRSLSLEPGGGGGLQELELSSPLQVFGQVVNIANLPIGATVQAVDLSLFKDPSMIDFGPNTSSSQFAGGAFNLEGLSSDGKWVLVVVHDQFALTAHELTSQDVGQGVTLTASPGHDVQFSWDASAVEPGRLMVLTDAQNNPLTVIVPGLDLAHHVKLVPGAYNLVFWENGAWGKQITVDVPQGSINVDVTW